MFKNTLFMSFFLPDTELFISDFGKMLLEYEAIVKSAKPSNWGLYEPTRKFDAHFFERLNAAAEKDEFVPELQKLSWKKRKNPESFGILSAARMLANNAPLHMMEGGYIRLNIDEEETFSEVYSYFKHRLQHNQADYAYVEYMTYQRMLDYLGIDCCVYNCEETEEPSMIVTTHELRHWLPNLPWLAYFGKPYVELFGEEKLATAPVYRVEKIGESNSRLLAERYGVDWLNKVHHVFKGHQGSIGNTLIQKSGSMENAFVATQKAVDALKLTKTENYPVTVMVNGITVIVRVYVNNGVSRIATILKM